MPRQDVRIQGVAHVFPLRVQGCGVAVREDALNLREVWNLPEVLPTEKRQQRVVLCGGGNVSATPRDVC